MTIYYTFRSALTDVGDVRTLIDTTRQFARALPCQEVGKMVEFAGADADFESMPADDPYRWLKIQSCEYVIDPGGGIFTIKPLRIVAFTTWPGPGCKPASIGLCHYPSGYSPSRRPAKRLMHTWLKGWMWKSSCATLQASHSDHGGIENFLCCHLCVIKLLQFLRDSGLVQVNVCDEGGYWAHSDLSRIAYDLGDWKELLTPGAVKEPAKRLTAAVRATLAAFAHVEKLAAMGQQYLQAIRDRLSALDS